jgi:DNA polymerase-1
MNSPNSWVKSCLKKCSWIQKLKKTKTGQYATSEDVLQKLASKHEIIKHILEYRTYQKLKSTYVDALPSQIDKKITGYIPISHRLQRLQAVWQV